MSATPKTMFWRGFRDALPFVFVVGPFGMLFGVLATEAGLYLYETMTFSVTVFAGAAQFTALQLLLEQTPTIMVLISALAVNLRMAMYSASLTPYLGAAPMWQRALVAYFMVDQAYALSSVKYETEPELSLSQRLAYYAGTNAPIVPTWYLTTLAGAVLGAQIPDSYALDFALPLAFLAMIAPALRTLPHVIAAAVAVVVALLAVGLPYNLGLLVAGIAGMIAGAEAERQISNRKAS